jgi:hypothetical protein
MWKVRAVKGFWHRLFGRAKHDVEAREQEEEWLKPGERRIATEAHEDLVADRFVEDHLGGEFELERPDE